MGWKEFIASVVNSIIWPISLLLIIYWFRENLKILLGKISSFTFGSTSAKFSDDLSEITEQAEVNSELKTVPIYEDDNIKELARINPSLSIIESFRKFENSLRTLYESKEFRSKYTGVKYAVTPIHQIIKYLVEKGLLNNSDYNTYMKLSNIRNKVVHEYYNDISYSDAIAFYDLIKDLALKIESINF